MRFTDVTVESEKTKIKLELQMSGHRFQNKGSYFGIIYMRFSYRSALACRQVHILTLPDTNFHHTSSSLNVCSFLW